jgi:hypothetical protein
VFKLTGEHPEDMTAIRLQTQVIDVFGAWKRRTSHGASTDGGFDSSNASPTGWVVFRYMTRRGK